MSSDECGEEEVFLDPLSNVGREDFAIKKVFGNDLKLLGFVLNRMGGLLVVETSDPSIFSPGSWVMYEDYSEFGHIVDIFGPTSHPLYIVTHIRDKDIGSITGTPVYVCTSLCEQETVGEGLDSENSDTNAESSVEDAASELE
jgi:rRNA processing protein Gar1